jgi:hypothetical protein
MLVRKFCLAVVAVAVLAGCGGPSLPFIGSSSPKDIAVQQGDLPGGLKHCSDSGDINTFLKNAQTKAPDTYKNTQQEWKKLQDAGATDGYVQVFSDTSSECDSLFGAGQNAEKSPKVATNFVIKFKDDKTAAKAYDSGILGITPKNSKNQQGVTEGSATGLGSNSVVFSQSFGNQSLYLAFWQNKTYDLFLFTINLPSADSKKAASNVNGRAAG